MDVYDAIHARTSAGAFAGESLPREVIERVIEAATWAPNHHLTEPWRFHVLTGAGRGAMAEAIAGCLLADGTPKESELQKIRSKLDRSPVVVVVTQARGSLESAKDAEHDLEDYAAVAAATQNLLLAATAEGLASKWSTGSMCDYRGAREYLGLGARDRIVAYVYLGYPTRAQAPEDRERRAPEIAWREG